eukprot:2340986-Rhodomonas_salina.2
MNVRRGCQARLHTIIIIESQSHSTRRSLTTSDAEPEDREGALWREQLAGKLRGDEGGRGGLW